MDKKKMKARDWYVVLGLDPGIRCRLMLSLRRCDSYANRVALS